MKEKALRVGSHCGGMENCMPKKTMTYFIYILTNIFVNDILYLTRKVVNLTNNICKNEIWSFF
jgi:hypothetical protein